jgi:thioredoxin-related protein
MNRRWIIVAFLAAAALTAIVRLTRVTVTPGEEAAVAQLGWLTDFETARARSKAENRLLLMNFTGSDWCPPCMLMRKRVFAQPAFAKYAAQQLVLLEVDFPRRKAFAPQQLAANESLAQQFGIESFPTLVVMTPEGKIVGRIRSVPDGPAALIAALEARP